MSETVKNITAGAYRYKLVIFYVVLFSFNSLATAIVGSFMNAKWAQLDGTAKFLLLVVIAQNWTGVMLAFFNKSISNVDDGKPIIDVGNAVAPAPAQPTPTNTLKI